MNILKQLMHILFRHLTLFTFSLLFTSTLYAKNASFSTTLNNGLKVIIQEDHRAPLVMLQIWYAVGSADEPENLLGISHVLEHMMFKGTIRVPDHQLKVINATYGGSLNAFTGNNYTYYYQFYPKDYVNLALELEADRMSNLYLRQQDFATEIKVVMEERRQRIDDNAQALAFEKFRAIAYPDSPYRNPVIGYMHNLEQLSLSDLQQWYKTWYAPNHATLVITGDIDSQQTLVQIQRYFGDIPAQVTKSRNNAQQQINTGYRHLEQKSSNVQVPNLYMAWNVPSLATSANTSQAYALSLLKNVLDGGISARLQQQLVHQQKVLTSVSVNYEMINRGDTLFTITAIPTENTSLATAQLAIENAINQLKTELLSDHELQKIQSRTLSQLVYAQDTLAGQAQLIGNFAVNGLDYHMIKELPNLYQDITAQDIQNVVQQFFNHENLATSYLQPEEKSDYIIQPQNNIIPANPSQDAQP